MATVIVLLSLVQRTVSTLACSISVIFLLSRAVCSKEFGRLKRLLTRNDDESSRKIKGNH